MIDAQMGERMIRIVDVKCSPNDSRWDLELLGNHVCIAIRLRSWRRGRKSLLLCGKAWWYALSQACMPAMYPSLMTKTRSFAQWEYSGTLYEKDSIFMMNIIRFKKAAMDMIVATPRRLGVPLPSSMQLSQVALMTIASEPDARADVETA
jgi:hypothetical protein